MRLASPALGRPFHPVAGSDAGELEDADEVPAGRRPRLAVPGCRLQQWRAQVRRGGVEHRWTVTTIGPAPEEPTDPSEKAVCSSTRT